MCSLSLRLVVFACVCSQMAYSACVRDKCFVDETHVYEQALSLPALSDRRLQRNRGALLRLIRTFAPGVVGYAWNPQPEAAGIRTDETQREFLTNGNADSLFSPALGQELIRLKFFAAARIKKGRAGSSMSRRDRHLSTLIRKFLSDPEHAEESQDELHSIVFALTGVDWVAAQRIVSRLIPRLRMPPARAIATLQSGHGQGAVVKLPLTLSEFVAIINSPAERSLNVFRHARTRYLLVFPGSAMEWPDSEPITIEGPAVAPGFDRYAYSCGHSHPRFTESEFSEGDMVAPRNWPEIDHFVVSLVDLETIELSLWPAHSTTFRTFVGNEAINRLVGLGLVQSPRSHKERKLLSLIGLFFLFGNLFSEPIPHAQASPLHAA